MSNDISTMYTKDRNMKTGRRFLSQRSEGCISVIGLVINNSVIEKL